MNGISVATSEYNNVQIVPYLSADEVIGLTTTPHSIKTNDFVTISGLSTDYTGLGGGYRVGIVTSSLILRTGVATTDENVSYFDVSGTFSKILPNNFYKIDDEVVKILNADGIGSRIRVLRAQNGTTGAAHSLGTVLHDNRENLGSVLGFKPPKMSNLTLNFTLTAKVLVLGQLLELELEIRSLLQSWSGKTQIFIKPSKSTSQTTDST